MSDRKPMNKGYTEDAGIGKSPSTPKPNIPPPSQKSKSQKPSPKQTQGQPQDK